MPSESQSHAEPSRATFPTLRDKIDEDPARFLDHDIFGTPCGMGRMMRARIQGIDDLETIRAWRAVERKINRGPRERVLEWLDDREEELEEIGERPDRLKLGPRRPPEWFDSESAIEIEYGSAADKVADMRARTDGGSDDA
jgi:hypothetical protein